MTRRRDEKYVWITWLARLMAGEVKCRWAPWFKTNYTGYTRAPSDFKLAVWQAEHTQLLDELVRELSGLGEKTYLEDQNAFRAPRRSSGLTVSGKPDLLAVDGAGSVTVYDAKTGRPKQSDIIQVMLYMMCLPHTVPPCKGTQPKGCVVYRSGERSEVPADAVDQAFTRNVSYFLDLLESDTAPARTPSPGECRYCDITREDCPDRLEADGDSDPPSGNTVLPI